MPKVETGEIVEKTLPHEGDAVQEFYSTLVGPTRVGIEATGSKQWFLELMKELGIDCQVGHPAKVRAAEPRKQKHDRRDAALVMQLLVENRFPSIWMPSRYLRLRYPRSWAFCTAMQTMQKNTILLSRTFPLVATTNVG